MSFFFLVTADEGAMERGYNVAVAGIPKTIDNDGKLASAIETLCTVHY